MLPGDPLQETFSNQGLLEGQRCILIIVMSLYININNGVS